MAEEGCHAAGKKVMKSLLKCNSTQMHKDAKCYVGPWTHGFEPEKWLFSVGEHCRVTKHANRVGILVRVVEDSSDVAAAVR